MSEITKKRLNRLYKHYSTFNLTFNQMVIKRVGLVADHIVLKFGDVKVPCILYSTSMKSSRIVVRLTERNLNYIKRRAGSVSLYYLFKPLENKHEIPFYINGKIEQFDHYDENKIDFYYCNINFSNRAPDDLIEIVGEYIDKQQNMHKRAEERFLVNNDAISRSNSLSNYLFISGSGKRAILTEISMFSAKLLVVLSEDEVESGEKVMLIIRLKGLEGTGEMIGEIIRIERVNDENDLFSVVISFDQDMIPPSYKMWISEFIESVPKKN